MARFAVNDSIDHSATLWIVTFLLLSYTTLTTLMRGFLKFSMLGVDDAVASLAQLLVYGNILSIIYALRHGLAKSVAHDQNGKKEPEYADVSNMESQFLESKLIKLGTPSEHDLLPTVISCSQSRHYTFLEKSLPTIKLHTYHAAVQHRTGSCGRLGGRVSRGCVHRLRCNALVGIAWRCYVRWDCMCQSSSLVHC